MNDAVPLRRSLWLPNRVQAVPCLGSAGQWQAVTGSVSGLSAVKGSDAGRPRHPMFPNSQ